MNAARIEQLARQVAHLTEALVWLTENGQNALNPKDRDAFSITVHLNSCSALRGAAQATIQLGAVARHFAPHILEQAIQDARNTIEIYRSEIMREAETPPTPPSVPAYAQEHPLCDKLPRSDPQ